MNMAGRVTDTSVEDEIKMAVEIVLLSEELQVSDS